MPPVSTLSTYPRARLEVEARMGVAQPSTHRQVLEGAFKTAMNTLKAQLVTPYGGPTGGTFTLGHPASGGTSNSIGFDDTAAEVLTALEAITALDGKITVSGPDGGPWVVTGEEDLLERLLTVDSSLTGGATPGVEVTHVIGAIADRDMAMDALLDAAERAAEGLRKIPAAPATAWTPASLSSVVLWMDAQYAPSVLNSAGSQAQNGQAVASWVDRIGGSITFAEVSGSGPTLHVGTGPNGTRFLRGNGTDKYLRYAASAPLNHSAGEIFLVLRSNEGATRVVFSSADEASTTRFAYVALFGSTQQPEFSQNDNGTSDRLRGEDRIPLQEFVILNVGSSGTATRMAVAGGAEHTLSAVTGSNAGDWFADTSARDNLTLFCLRTTSASSFFNGDIAEVIVTNAALTALQRSYILNYLKSKYTPLVQVCGFGDSHTEGSIGWVDSLRPMLAASSTLGGISVVNHGVGSETISDIRARWLTDGLPKGYDVLVFLGGTNDVKIASAGAAEATLWPLLEATYDEAMAAGMRVVAITVFPFKGLNGDTGTPGWSTTRQTELDILNRLIREKCAKNPGLMVCVDAYTLLGDPDEPRKIRTIWDAGYPGAPDSLHANVAGYDVVAAAVMEALRGLLT